MNRVAVLPPLLGALLLSAVACSSDTDGRAVPSHDTTRTTKQAPTESEDTTAPTSSGSASLDPCELVPDAVMGELGLSGPGKREEAPSSEGCTWRVTRGSIAASYTIGVLVYRKVGLADIVGQDKQETTVGSHKAVRSLRSGGGGCAYAMEMTETSRVEVLAVGANGEDLCAPALRLAEAVERQVP